MRTVCFLPLIFCMNTHAQSIEDLLEKLNQRLLAKNQGEYRVSIAENHSIIQEWEELQALTAYVNANPIEAAEYLLADSSIERFPITSAAAEAQPLPFVRFWNRISKEPSLTDEQIEFVQFGLISNYHTNYFTLSFNHDIPAIAELLNRLAKLAERNRRVFEDVERIRSGWYKEVQLDYLRTYEWGYPKPQFPDLSSLKVGESGDMELLAPDGSAEGAKSHSFPGTTVPMKPLSADLEWGGWLRSSTGVWTIIVTLTLAALGLVWWRLKRRS